MHERGPHGLVRTTARDLAPRHCRGEMAREHGRGWGARAPQEAARASTVARAAPAEAGGGQAEWGLIAQSHLGSARDREATATASGQAAAALLVFGFTRANLWLILVTLFPVPPLDGAEAWGVIRLIGAARARRRMDAALALAARHKAGELAALPERLHALDELDAHDLPPLSDEVKRVVDRVMAEGGAAHETEKKK